MEDDEVLTPLEVAQRLRITKNTVYELIKRGELQGYKAGKKIRIDATAVENYKNRNSGMNLPVATPPFPYETPREYPGDSSFVIAGQDILLDILARHLEHHPRGVRALRSYIGSYNGLYALYKGNVSVATTHLQDPVSGEYNLPFVRLMLPGVPAIVIRLTARQIGFYVKKGNPRSISAWEDLRQEGLTLINRERGSGMRILLDHQLGLLGIPNRDFPGYHREVSSHLAVASAVSRGSADVGIGNEKTGMQVQGVDFVPLLSEKYDLVIKKEDLNSGPFQAVLDILHSPEFRLELEGLGGYDLSELGRIVGVT